ncbi:16609_t:CDS:10 [Funneliformis caledonium]|uniref:16609_t:CDS:1 n=1 Tax=Funneliformis caledonium TaxID=1117310 RepID=A0A9N8WGC8_9GLOM|nr:16609_t:CDS:10 [Funneliformis caledonium]
MSHDNIGKVDKLVSPNKNESFSQFPLEHESMIRVTEGEGDHVSKVFADDANECFTEMLDEISDPDPVMCNNLENVVTRDLTFEEPLFPENTQLENNHQAPTIKSLTSKFTRFNVPEPFLDEKTFKMEDLCTLRDDELAIKKEFEQKDETISFEGLRSNDKYHEESLLPIKDINCVQDVPNSISEIVSLVRPEVLMDKADSVIEDTGVRAPLEMMNEGAGRTNNLEESLNDDSKEDEVIHDIPTLIRLEPVLIPAEHDLLEEVHQRKRRQVNRESWSFVRKKLKKSDHMKYFRKQETSSEDDDEILMNGSVISVINHVFPENTIPTPPENEELRRGLDNVTHAEILGNKWQMLAMMQSMDESELSSRHPLKYTSGEQVVIPSRPSTCDFRTVPHKILEHDLHWNPIKTAAKLGIVHIIALNHTSHDYDLTEIIQEGSSFLDSENFLALADVEITNKDDKTHLKSRKEKKRGEVAKRSEIQKSGSTFIAPQDKPATSFSIDAYDNHSLSYSRRKDPPIKSSNQKEKSVKQNVSTGIQPLLRKPTARRSRNVDNPIPDIMSWIRIGNENEKAPSLENVNDSIPNVSGQDRVPQRLSDLRNNNDVENYDDIECIDLTRDTESPAPKISAPEIPIVHYSSKTSPFFKNKVSSQNRPNLFDTTLFPDSFSATRSIDDYMLLRGKLSPGRRREDKAPRATSSLDKIARKIVTPDNATSPTSHVTPVTNQSVSILNKDSFVSISKAMLDRLPKPKVPYKYIASARILPNRGLLTALKSRDCKVELIERDFEYMRPFLSERESDAIHVDVDIIIDERTGAIFYPLNKLAQGQTVSKLVQTVNRLRLKYTNLYLILEAYTWKNRPASKNTEHTITAYPFTLPTLRAISELQSILMCSNCDDVQVMFSLCEEMSAKLLRMIGNRCAMQCDELGINKRGWKDHKQWESRDWMAMEESLVRFFVILKFLTLTKSF